MEIFIFKGGKEIMKSKDIFGNVVENSPEMEFINIGEEVAIGRRGGSSSRRSGGTYHWRGYRGSSGSSGGSNNSKGKDYIIGTIKRCGYLFCIGNYKILSGPGYLTKMLSTRVLAVGKINEVNKTIEITDIFTSHTQAPYTPHRGEESIRQRQCPPSKPCNKSTFKPASKKTLISAVDGLNILRTRLNQVNGSLNVLNGKCGGTIQYGGRNVDPAYAISDLVNRAVSHLPSPNSLRNSVSQITDFADALEGLSKAQFLAHLKWSDGTCNKSYVKFGNAEITRIDYVKRLIENMIFIVKDEIRALTGKSWLVR